MTVDESGSFFYYESSYLSCHLPPPLLSTHLPLSLSLFISLSPYVSPLSYSLCLPVHPSPYPLIFSSIFFMSF